MSRHFDNERQLQGRIEAVLAGAMPDIEVLEVELDSARETVRVFVDREGGVDLGLCTEVTHAIRDTCPDFSLEVSSPGIERPLRHARHLAAFVGHPLRLRRAGRQRAARVELIGVDSETGITVRSGDGVEELVPLDEIVRCRLVVDDPFAASATRPGERKGRT